MTRSPTRMRAAEDCAEAGTRRSAARMRASSSGVLNGLVDEIVRARIQRLHFVGFGVAHRQHDDSDASARANLAARGQPAHARHVDVEQHQIGMIIAQLLQRLFAGFGVVHFISGAGESGAHDAADLGLVVHDENASGAHRCAPSPSVVVKGKVIRKVVSSGTAVYRELSVVRLHDVVCDCETQAEARNLILDRRAAIKALEEAALLLFRNPWAAIGDLELDDAVAIGHAHRDGRARRGILERIVEHLLERQLQQPAIERELRQRSLQLESLPAGCRSGCATPRPRPRSVASDR